MSVYITDDKNKVIYHYCTTRKIEKAIQTLLEQVEDLVGSVSHKGYMITYTKVDEEDTE